MDSKLMIRICNTKMINMLMNRTFDERVELHTVKKAPGSIFHEDLKTKPPTTKTATVVESRKVIGDEY